MGVRQRLELLDPAQRGGPTEPRQAGDRVGDESEGVGDPEHQPGVPGRPVTVRCHLAGQRAHRQEHGGTGDEGDGEEQRGRCGQVDARRPTDHHDDRRSERPEEEQTAAEAGDRLPRGSPAGRRPGEQELPATTVLLAAEQLRAGQQTPHAADDAENDQALPRGEAADRLQPVRRAGDRRRAAIGAELVGQPEALGGRRIARRVAERG